MTDKEFCELIEIERRRAVDAYRHELYDAVSSYFREANEIHSMPMSLDLGEGYRMVHEDLLSILKRNKVNPS